MTEQAPTPKPKKASAAPTPKATAADKKPATASASAPATKAPAKAPAAPPAPPAPPSTALVPPPAPGSYVPPAATQPYAPQPMLETDARMWAMLLHILAAVALVLSAGTLAFVVPLVVWLIYKDRSALIDWHGKQNLNLQLTALVVAIGGTLLGFLILFGVGFIFTGPIMIAYGIYALIISIIAGVKANAGEYYKIPVVIPFLR